MRQPKEVRRGFVTFFKNKKLWWILFHRTFKPIYFARWRFEEQIKRPYFHVKPLERAQLKNWHEYLEFMKVSGHSLSSWRYRVIHWVQEGIGSFAELKNWHEYLEFMKVWVIHWLHECIGSFIEFMKISGHSLILISTAYVKYLYQYVISNV